METAVISYRVADFLKKHSPFNAVDDADLLALAARGRVRFYEPNEFLLWQGEPHRYHVFVIQQGTASLWDEAGGEAHLRDVRGAGDLIGVERYNDASTCLYSVRSESDLVIYAFPAEDFEQYILKHPHAAQYVAAEGRVTADYQGAAARRNPQRTFLHAAVGQRPLSTCGTDEAIATVAARLLDARSGAIAVLDGGKVRAVLTAETLLGWVAAGGGDAHMQPIGGLLTGTPVIVPADASVTDGVIELGQSGAGALAITADGTAHGRLQALVTPGDLAPSFGEQPTGILRDIRLARSLGELRELNQRARAFTLDALSGPGAVEWLARLTHLVDAAIVSQILAISGAAQPPGCWCFYASSGRAESLTSLAPHIVVIGDERDDPAGLRMLYRQVLEGLAACGYLTSELSHDVSYFVAGASEWQERYRGWVRDPIMTEMYRARTMFDLRPVLGQRSLWDGIDRAIADTMHKGFLHVLANDCRTSLPPLTFYQDEVVDIGGEHMSTFLLEESALRPLVDVARVYGMAGGQCLSRSTLDRLETTRTLLPEHEAVFREAADTFRVVLWLQSRVGINQGTSGDELPPALLSRHDRQVLKAGFRSLLRLLEFTAERSWLDAL